MKNTKTFTVWFSNQHAKRMELLTESEMRGAAARFGFDPERVLICGEDWLWSEGVTPYDNPKSTSDDVFGGCFSVKG